MSTGQVGRETFDEVMVPNYNPQAIVPVRGEGSRLWDQEGREYIDFAGGIAVNALGHCHPALVEALETQGRKLWHLSNVYTNEPALKLAQQLTQKTFAERVFFANSGAEANEAAFKLARKYGHDHHGEGKFEIISFEQSFHGRTLFTVTVGGQLKYRQGFEPVPGGVTHVPYNDIGALKKAISERTCAVVMEPIQGEGGVIPADPLFAQQVRQLCDDHQALLIYDEIQTGAGRTGHLYEYMAMGVTPDILTSAKGLGCGFPIGAMLTRADIAESFGFGAHGSTFGGNPLGCAVAGRALELISDPQLLVGVGERHDQLVEGLRQINSRQRIFREIRGKGLLIGAELVESWHGQAGQFLAAAREQGVLLLMAGPNVLRFTPSLIMPQGDISEGLAKLETAIGRIKASE
ncbi:acetylornithine aminotransferase [Marinobacterium nitratireducens]|uniref:Acetylornithine aminotransferase n=1 Tax=Marinobacterium nitratireducens TaxID=518897 RepID=A0A918DZA5_9GAMM|nr:aspartate aminotransferase family protein [Marinobacterium nitratireducens]GGO89500.1 acetylornithine aminotransferase [Marinobacterium nitratireducens]